MTPNTFQGMFQTAWQKAHYRNNVTIRESDRRIAESNEARANLTEFLQTQLKHSFKTIISSDIVTPTTAPTGTGAFGTGTDMTDAIQSLRWILSNANVVGGYDQALDANWQAVYNTASGPFSLSFVNQDMNTVRKKGRSKVDFFLAADAAGGFVYTKFEAAIAPGERWENKDFTRKAGIENYVYRGATVLLDNQNVAGELIGIASDTHFVHLPEPTALPPNNLDGTDAWQTVYNLCPAIACNDIGCNIRRTGLT